MDREKSSNLRDLELAKASRDGDLEAMEWLIVTLGCDPNATSHIGAPLVLAAYHGRFEAVEFLLNTESKRLKNKTNSKFHSRNNRGRNLAKVSISIAMSEARSW